MRWRISAKTAAISGVSLASVEVDDAATSRRTLRVSLDSAIDSDHAVEALMQALIRAGVGVHAVVPDKASLEQVFSELTRHEKEAETQAASAEEAR